MPRHGTAIAEAASPPEPVPAPSSRPVARSRGLSGWPIRRKLAALVAPPLVIILAAGALLGFNAFGNLQDARRAQAISQAIVLSGEATLALQEEINQAIVGASIGADGNGPDKNSLARLDTLIAKTDEARAALLTSLESPPAGGWSADATLAGKEIQDSTVDLAQARKDAKSNRNYSFADTAYQRALRVHLGLTNSLARDLTTATADSRLASAATTISAMSGLADAASSERTEGAVLLAKAPVVPGDKISAQSLGNYLTYIQTQAIQASIAQRFATANAIELLNTAQSTDADTIERYRRDIVNLSTAIDPREDFRVGKAIEFSEVAGQRVQRIDNALTRMADDTNAIAEDVARTALLRTALVIGIALAMLVIGILLAAAISKTVTVPLRRLRSAAVEAATVRLPAAVRQIERQGPDAVPALPPVLPPGTAAGPETLEVAAAVDGLTTEALRLATAQVRLRQAIDEAFVSMSRRSQSMVEKQLSIIDELESTEEDPDQLRNLFRLDHLAARMRRYNDNLLVLAGSTVRTRSAAPVPVADIFRAATSEMEQYERVRLQPISGTAIAGPAAGGLIHLLAELLDNAAMYSPPTSPILLTAQFMPDGGLHLEVTDSGVGIPPTELAELNARLNTPGTLDAQVPSRMGLFVVARLAQRGGLRVRLSPRANAAGTVAEVIVPPALVAGGPAGESQPSAFGDIPAAPAGPAGPGVVGPAGSNGFGGLGPAASPFPVPSPSSEPARTAPAEPARSAPFAPAAAAGAAAALAPSARRTADEHGANGTNGTNGTAVPQVAGGSSPLPSRRPGAVLSGGPLAAAAAPRAAEPAPPTPPPGSAGLFGVAPATSGNPFEPAAGDGDTTTAPAESGPTDGAPRNGAGPDGARPPLRGATAAWSARPDARTLPTRSRGASGPPAFGSAAEVSTSRPSADSPTAVPPAPSFGSIPTATSARDSATDVAPAPSARRDEPAPAGRPAGTDEGSTPADARTDARTDAPADAPGGLPRRQRGASTPPAAPFAFPTASPSSSAASSAPFGSPLSPPAPAPEAAPADEPATDQAPAAAAVTPVEGKAAPTQEVTQTRPSMGEGAALTGELPVRGRTGDALPPVKPSAAPVPPVAVPGARPDGNGNGHGNGHGPASSGGAPGAWNPSLPTELAARSAADAAAQRYRPANPNAPMIGSDSPPASSAPTPIFDSISVWFSTDASAPSTGAVDEVEHVVDLRDGARQTVTAGAPSSNRWAALGDQQWLAASARAAATPEISGTTGTGLPMRRPGANLVPSAAGATTASAPAAAGGRPAAVVTAPSAPVHRADPEAVRGRLGSYQRGLTSARRSRRAPGDGDTLFAGPKDGNGTTKTPEGTGGDT